MPAAITVERLSVSFSQGFRKPRLCALRDFSLQVEAGEIVGILGPNGSGKTTLLRVLGGELAARQGRVEILGHPAGSPALVRSVGYQPETTLPFGSLGARDWLVHLGALLRIPKDQVTQRSEEWLDRLGLSQTGDRPVKHFSTGMSKRLALIGALLSDPKVLLLDEPTSGLDPQGSLLVMEILQQRAEAGGTVLMASHQLQEVEQVCDRALLIAHGHTLAEGPLRELLGTSDWQLLLRDLDETGWQQVERAVQEAGGRVLERGRAHRPLQAVFRELMQAADNAAPKPTDQEPRGGDR